MCVAAHSNSTPSTMQHNYFHFSIFIQWITILTLSFFHLVFVSLFLCIILFSQSFVLLYSIFCNCFSFDSLQPQEIKYQNQNITNQFFVSKIDIFQEFIFITMNNFWFYSPVYDSISINALNSIRLFDPCDGFLLSGSICDRTNNNV